MCRILDATTIYETAVSKTDFFSKSIVQKLRLGAHQISSQSATAANQSCRRHLRCNIVVDLVATAKVVYDKAPKDFFFGFGKGAHSPLVNKITKSVCELAV